MQASACSSVNISVCMEETSFNCEIVCCKLSYKHCTETEVYVETDSMLNPRLVMYRTV